jgi:uncharacterized protein (TIGR00156 family)
LHSPLHVDFNGIAFDLFEFESNSSLLFSFEVFMKKVLITAFVLAISTTFVPAFAQFQGSPSSGGFTGPGAANRSNTVADILKNPIDDQRVTLQGKVIRHVGGDKYIFTDGTGEIRVDIDDHQFPPQPINEKTTVVIMGEVDSDFMQYVEIDVKSVRIVQ